MLHQIDLTHLHKIEADHPMIHHISFGQEIQLPENVLLNVTQISHETAQVQVVNQTLLLPNYVQINHYIQIDTDKTEVIHKH